MTSDKQLFQQKESLATYMNSSTPQNLRDHSLIHNKMTSHLYTIECREKIIKTEFAGSIKGQKI